MLDIKYIVRNDTSYPLKWQVVSTVPNGKVYSLNWFRWQEDAEAYAKRLNATRQKMVKGE